MNKKYVVGIVLGIVVIGLLTLAIKHKGSVSVTSSDKIQVATSFYPLYFFSSQIGGDKANVVNITPSGGEPHDYEPTAQDIAEIENSKLLILNGGGLEAWGASIQKNINSNKTIIVTAGLGLTNQKVAEEGESITDPHVWLSPPLAEQIVDRIAAGFKQADPTNADYYEANAQTLKSQLADLDVSYKAGLASCAQKNIITSHAAFGYLATAYNLKQVPITGLSPDAEPSPKELADITQFARANNVKYIFFESLVSPKLSETIAHEIGAQTLVLNPIEGLTPDEVSAGKTYLTEMQNNLKNLKTALECKQ
ncbi:MAG: zinc ABC transporter substrate-binding protein [Candidatus Parcubacteria bacterium]|nr:zinc ABC transporter substrate-binding protein [Candidatus Parcubacteria bacterium]